MIELLGWVNDITITELYNISKKLGVENHTLSIMGVTDFGLFKGDNYITLDEEDLEDKEMVDTETLKTLNKHLNC